MDILQSRTLLCTANPGLRDPNLAGYAHNEVPGMFWKTGCGWGGGWEDPRAPESSSPALVPLGPAPTLAPGSAPAPPSGPLVLHLPSLRIRWTCTCSPWWRCASHVFAGDAGHEEVAVADPEREARRDALVDVDLHCEEAESACAMVFSDWDARRLFSEPTLLKFDADVKILPHVTNVKTAELQFWSLLLKNAHVRFV